MARATACIPCLPCLAGFCCIHQHDEDVHVPELPPPSPKPLKSILKPARKPISEEGPETQLGHEQIVATVPLEQPRNIQIEQPQDVKQPAEVEQTRLGDEEVISTSSTLDLKSRSSCSHCGDCSSHETEKDEHTVGDNAKSQSGPASISIAQPAQDRQPPLRRSRFSFHHPGSSCRPIVLTLLRAHPRAAEQHNDLTADEVKGDNKSAESDRAANEVTMDHVILHPLVLISISDYVVRHTLRQHEGPVVGALLGQQNGREISIEYAYEVKIIGDGNGEGFKLDVFWFEERLEQMRIVHKDRSLDLVGWYTLLPRSGPGSNVAAIHAQILERNESAILLGLHTEEIGDESVGGKLPVTLYETVYEVDGGSKEAQDDGEDKEMKDGDAQLKQKFREIPFVVETGEAEMISMNSIAGGATNAASAQVREKQKEQDKESDAKAKGKGKDKGKQTATETEKADPNTVALSKEDEEMVASLQTKANAIRMLKSRIDLITKYLEKLPPPYLVEVQAEAQAGGDDPTEPSQTLLRLIQALVHRLSLVEPADAVEFKTELLREENDVQTISLLNELMSRVNDTRDVGRKFSAVEAGKAAQKQHGSVANLGNSQLHASMSSAGDLM